MRGAHQNHLPTFEMLEQDKKANLSSRTFIRVPHVNLFSQHFLEDSLFEGDEGTVREVSFLEITAIVTHLLEKRSSKKVDFKFLRLS